MQSDQPAAVAAMSCGRARAALLATVVDVDEASAARTHVLTCPLCAMDVVENDRRLVHRLAPLRHPCGVVRALLLVMGVAQVIISLPWLFGSSVLWRPSSTAPSHLTRDGVIGLVLGAIGIAVALAPRLSYFALSVCGLLATLQVVAFAADRAGGRVHSTFEVIHVLTLVISALVTVEAFPRRHRQ